MTVLYDLCHLAGPCLFYESKHDSSAFYEYVMLHDTMSRNRCCSFKLKFRPSHLSNAVKVVSENSTLLI